MRPPSARANSDTSQATGRVSRRTRTGGGGWGRWAATRTDRRAGEPRWPPRGRRPAPRRLRRPAKVAAIAPPPGDTARSRRRGPWPPTSGGAPRERNRHHLKPSGRGEPGQRLPPGGVVLLLDSPRTTGRPPAARPRRRGWPGPSPPGRPSARPAQRPPPRPPRGGSGARAGWPGRLPQHHRGVLDEGSSRGGPRRRRARLVAKPPASSAARYPACWRRARVGIERRHRRAAGDAGPEGVGDAAQQGPGSHRQATQTPAGASR